jgi:hypothetical protein
MRADAVLCYVRYPWAYFTTCPLDKQWGDDWNDAPYEHNAGEPYAWHQYMAERGLDKYDVFRVAFDGNLDTPCEGKCNSEWSVEDINGGAVPWLTSLDGDVKIMAGTTYADFVPLVRRARGNIYEPVAE